MGNGEHAGIDLAGTDIWAITSYFNPTKSWRRRHNYQRFRESLCLPLVTVELSLDGTFELSSHDDAKIIHRVHSSTLLWHKESLLNLALELVPRHIPYVTWLDCDVIFPVSPAQWRNAIVEKLKCHRLVQLFTELKELGPDESLLPEIPPLEQVTTLGLSQASILAEPEARNRVEQYLPNNSSPRSVLPGIAWASHAELLRQHRLYDGMITGGGDSAFFLAAIGRGDLLASQASFSPRQQEHYLAWAEPFFESVQGDVASLATPVLHFWHGEIARRQYKERHEKLASLGFDPAADLERDSVGLWKWKRPRPDLENYFRDYFQNRQDDDSPLAPSHRPAT